MTEETGFKLELEDFINNRPFLYHLTDRENLPSILERGEIWSAELLCKSAFTSNKKRKTFLRTKRPEHTLIVVNGKDIRIRDQKPISMTVLQRSLSNGWQAEDFIEHLNKRVFMWPTLNRLIRHFNRYRHENPVIIRVSSEEIFNVNEVIEFAPINSGATRCHPSYNGNAPTRGKETFLPSNQYTSSVASVAEVTFRPHCVLPDQVWYSSLPSGAWTKHSL